MLHRKGSHVKTVLNNTTKKKKKAKRIGKMSRKEHIVCTNVQDAAPYELVIHVDCCAVEPLTGSHVRKVMDM